MKAEKVILTIKMEALSLDVAKGLVFKALDQVEKEFPNGELQADDGDSISWKVDREPVEF